MTGQPIETRARVIYDTDLGGDVDDALALAYLVKSELIDLRGVFTVYGPTEIRSREAKTLLMTIGNEEVMVFSGGSEPLSEGKTVWTTGHEDYLVEDVEVSEGDLWEVVVSQTESSKMTFLATGPLSNMAKMIEEVGVEEFGKRVERIVLMGGAVGKNQFFSGIEHNFAADPLAAKIVVESGLPIVIIPVDLTLDWPMTEGHRSRIGKAGGRDTELLAKWIDKWREVTRTFPENIPFLTWFIIMIRLQPCILIIRSYLRQRDFL